MKGMTEEAKKQQSEKFDSKAAEEMKKMQDLTKLIKNANKADEFENSFEKDEEDEYANYMEERLLADAQEMGIFEKASLAAQTDEYTDALKKITDSVASRAKKLEEAGGDEMQIDTATTTTNIDKNKPQNNDFDDADEFDKYGDDMMREMEQAAEESMREMDSDYQSQTNNEESKQLRTGKDTNSESYQGEYESVISHISDLCC